MTKCPLCDYQHENLSVLSAHWYKVHKLKPKQLRIELFHNGIQPLCEFGCGTTTKFHSVKIGFSRFVRGHSARVFNGWVIIPKRRTFNTKMI